MEKISKLIFAILIFFALGCNKTGIKGTVIYGPTNSPIEDIEISAIPKLNTEEKSSYIKKAKSDKNGEFKITGLEMNYNYFLVVGGDKYIQLDPKSQYTVGSFEKNQTKLLSQPIIVKDVLPGIGCYVKRDKGKFDEVIKFSGLSKYDFTYYFRGLGKWKMHTYTNPTIFHTTEDIMKNSNATKVKNGDIIYFNIASYGGYAIRYWFISSLQKATHHENCKEDFINFGLENKYIGGGLYLEKFYDGVDRVSCLGIERYSESHKNPRTETYYNVSLPKGYYLISNYDFSDKLNERSNTFIVYIIEVTDDNEENVEGG